MDYEKKYKEAIKKAEALYKEAEPMSGCNVLLETVFPELKNNEDEKIRKEIISAVNLYCTGYLRGDKVRKDMLAWIEKQGDTNETIDRDEFAQGVLRGAAINLITWIDYNAVEGNMCLSNMECKDIEDSLVSGDWGKIYAYLKKKLEKQASPVLSNSSNNGKDEDKVESKFKAGDWITNGIETIQITGYDIDYGYQVDYKGNLQHRDTDIIEKEYHLWTIQDAKDGDVLCYKDEISLYRHNIKNCTKQETTFGGFVYHCCYDGKRFVVDSLYSLTEQDKMDIHPTTKEQRDLLFQKMHEAGYEWDTEKKELKKIHVIDEGKAEMDYCFTKMMNGEKVSPTWSEEDERMMKSLTFLFDDISQNIKRDFRVISDVGRDNYENWLKSLKDRLS